MKRRDCLRTTEQLIVREQYLEARFLHPIMNISTWSPDAIDLASAYIALVHAEAEFAIESLVRHTLANARATTERWRPHPVLINSVMHFRGELAKRMMGISPLPPTNALRSDANSLIYVWEKLGAREYYENTIELNHGVGHTYLEALLHPLGVVVTEKSFGRVKGHGVLQIARLPGGVSTELTEFVVLRGAVVHTSVTTSGLPAGLRLRQDTPQQIARRGKATASFVQSLGRLLVRRAW
jgi:hypothetical protein